MAQPDESQLKLLEERRIASVATIDPTGTPHLTAVWFLYQDGALYLAIPSSSVKGRNLANDARIAVMIDVRQSGKESGLTAIGKAELIRGAEAAPIVRRLHEKYISPQGLADPRVGPVFAGIDDVAVRVAPTRWISWDMRELDEHVFGGAMTENGYLKEIDK